MGASVKVFNIVTAIVTAGAFATAILCATATQTAAAEPQGPIQIVTALYGKPSGERGMNFTTRLQQTCGDTATTCQAFCSDAFVGRPSGSRSFLLPVHPICRVIYRCGSDTTQTAEADRNEILDLDCRR